MLVDERKSIMKNVLFPFCLAIAIGGMAPIVYGQDQPPAPHSPARVVPTPAAAPSPESPQNTTNAAAQARADYKAAQAKCNAQPEASRDACLRDARTGYEGALSGSNPGLQGNPGSNTGNTGASETPK
jgi:hypothetical protein